MSFSWETLSYLHTQLCLSKTIFKLELASFSKKQFVKPLFCSCACGVSFSMCVILSLDEFYVSPVTSSIKGWVGGFAPLREGIFSSFPPKCSFHFTHPRKHFLFLVFWHKKATPFGPNGRKVLKLSPMKKSAAIFCVRHVSAFWFCFSNVYVGVSCSSQKLYTLKEHTCA